MNDFLQSLRNGQAEKPRTPKTRKNSDNSYSYTSGPRFNSYGGGGGYQNSRNQPMKRQPPPGLPQQQGNHVPAEDPSMTLMADVLDNLSNHVETLVKNQEYMITVQERTADMLQRQADAIEHILAHLNIGPAVKPTPAPQPAPAFENHYVTSQDLEAETEIDGLDDVTVDELMAAEIQKNQAPKKKVQPRQTRKVVQPPQQKTDKSVLRKRRKVARKEEPMQTPGNTKLLGRDVIMGIINDMRAEGDTYDQVAKRLVDLGQPTFSGRGEWHAQTIHRLCSKK